MSEALTASKTQGEFSVWWQDPTGMNHCELLHCGPEEAVLMAIDLTNRPAAKIGVICDVKITDGGDCTNWHWKDGAVIFDGGHTLPMVDIHFRSQ